MVGNFRCSRRPAGSERPGLKLGRHQPLFHFPSLGCYVTCLWGILLDPCLEAVRLGFHLSRFVRVADDHKSVPNRLLSVHQFRLVEAASEVFAAVVLDELYRLRQCRQSYLNAIALRLNQRPRKTLGFQTPADRLQAVLH